MYIVAFVDLDSNSTPDVYLYQIYMYPPACMLLTSNLYDLQAIYTKPHLATVTHRCYLAIHMYM